MDKKKSTQPTLFVICPVRFWKTPWSPNVGKQSGAFDEGIKTCLTHYIDSHVEFPDLTGSYNLSEGHAICRSVICLFLTLWFMGCHNTMKFSLGTERKTVDIFTGLLKNRYKFLLWVRQISQMRCRCGSQPMLTKKYFAYFFHIIFDLYPYPPFFRHSSTKRDKQEKHYGRNNTCPNEHDNMFSFHFVPPWNVLSIFFRAISSVPPK